MDAYWDDYLYHSLGRPAATDQPAASHAPLAAESVAAVSEVGAEQDADAALQAEYGTRAPASDTGDAARPASPVRSASPVLQTDSQIHDALSSELLRMAGVLKRNTAAFGDALERDRQLVEQAGTRLDHNLSLMTRTRGQLGVVSKKARSMGWFTLLSMAMVFVSWVGMYIVIRLT